MATQTLNGEIAKNVRETAKKNKIPLDDVALGAGIASRTFTRRMTGQSARVSDELAAVAHVLGVKASDLLASSRS